MAIGLLLCVTLFHDVPADILSFITTGEVHILQSKLTVHSNTFTLQGCKAFVDYKPYKQDSYANWDKIFVFNVRLDE